MDAEKNQQPIYLMPLIGKPWFNAHGGVAYRERQTLLIQYQTDPKSITKLLPPNFKLTNKPIVTIGFTYSDGVDTFAGRGYGLASISVSATYNGANEQVDGSYSIVMYENETTPIIAGRELLGVPKIYGDLSPPKIYPDGRIRCEVSLWGHLLFGIEVKPDNKQPEKTIVEMNKNPRGLPLLGYKYIHRIDGAADAAYAVATPSDTLYGGLWTGSEGRVYYGDPDESDVGFDKHVLDAIKSLNVERVLGVSRVYSSSVLRVDLAKQLT